MVKQYKNEQADIFVFQKSKKGKSHCGDAHLVIMKDPYIVCAVVDGLGSGEGAYLSAATVTDVIETEHDKSVEQIVDSCNRALMYKRGAVLTIVKIDLKKQELRYCNVGNIGFVLYQPDGTIVQPIPLRGYLCGRKQNIFSTCYRYRQGSVFVMYSDGVKMPNSKQELLRIVTSEQQVSTYFGLKDLAALDDATLLVSKLK